MPSSNKQTATNFLRLIIAGDIEGAYAKYAGAGFRHHNPFFKSDAESLKTGMKENETQFPNKLFDIHHVLEDGDLVALHSHLKFKPQDKGLAVLHLMRFEQGRIVELWDMAQPLPEESPNDRPMF